METDPKMAASNGSDILQRMRKNQKRIRKEMQKLQAQKEQLLSSNRVSYISRKRARTCLLTPESQGSKSCTKAKGKHANVSFLSPPEIIPPSPIHATPPPPHPPHKKSLRKHSSTPKVNDSLLKFHGQCLQESSIKPDVTTESTACADAGTRGEEESQDTASSTSPLADPSLEDAVFSAPHKTSASSSRKQGLNVSFIKDRDDLPTMQTTPDSSSVSRLQQSKQLVDSLRSSQYGGLERRLKATRSSRKLLDYSALDPSLGYDWIAGALDSEEGRGSVLDAPDEYFDMMKEFRRVNKDLCTRPTPLSPLNMTPKMRKTILSSLSGCGHQQFTTCTTSYVLNDRLFPVPIHESEDSRYCPVCEGTNKEDGIEEPPRFVRISVPRSSLQAPHRWKSHYSSRRQSFDSVQSMGLLHHCQTGWESARPVVVPTQETVDLSSSLIQAPLGSQRVTKDLLNMSYSTQYHFLIRSPVV